MIKLGLTVLVTFALCWLPFLTTFEDIQAVFVRLFPVNRGLYEDKVSNFWCAVSPVSVEWYHILFKLEVPNFVYYTCSFCVLCCLYSYWLFVLPWRLRFSQDLMLPGAFYSICILRSLT